MALSSQKVNLYEVLGLSPYCSAEEIRSSYKKLALQLHPDKLITQSGQPKSDQEGTAAFQELSNAYEVLSNKESRAVYDYEHYKVVFRRPQKDSSDSSYVFVPEVFSFFSNPVYSTHSGYSDSGEGFYKIYGDLFNKIYNNELCFASKLGLQLPECASPPPIGNLETPYEQVTTFYKYWLGFVTNLELYWAVQYDVISSNRSWNNKKVKERAMREYNESVRGLAKFVKKRDKRVIDMHNKPDGEKLLKKTKPTKQKNNRAKVLVEDDNEVDCEEEIVEEKKVLHCVVCGKEFLKDKQLKSHELSRKHKHQVAVFRETFGSIFEDFLAIY